MAALDRILKSFILYMNCICFWTEDLGFHCGAKHLVFEWLTHSLNIWGDHIIWGHLLIVHYSTDNQKKKLKKIKFTNTAIIKRTRNLQELKEKGNIWVRLKKLILTWFSSAKNTSWLKMWLYSYLTFVILSYFSEDWFSLLAIIKTCCFASKSEVFLLNLVLLLW